MIDESEEFVEMPEPAEFVPKSLRKAVDQRFPGTARAATFLAGWRRMREDLTLGQRLPYGKLPPFCEKYAKLLWDTHENAALRAMKVGDPAFFIAWLFRLDQIDVELIRVGSTVADRAVLIRARAAVDTYRQIATERLARLGGHWPP